MTEEIDYKTEDSSIKKRLEECSKSLESLEPLYPVFKYLEPLALLTIFIAFGFLLGEYAIKQIQIKDDTVITILILLPILGYIVLSGRLSSLKGPGGFEAQFAVASKQKIEVGYQMIEFENVEVKSKRGSDYLYREIIPNLQPSKPTVLTFTLGRKERNYDQEMILEYLNALSQYQAIKFAVFLNTERKLVAYTSLSQLKNILTGPNGREGSNFENNYEREGWRFVHDIMHGDTSSLLRYPGIMTTAISATSTNIEALQMMSDNNLETIIVVDASQRLKGIVQREQIISKLILSLAKGS